MWSECKDSLIIYYQNGDAFLFAPFNGILCPRAPAIPKGNHHSCCVDDVGVSEYARPATIFLPVGEVDGRWYVPGPCPLGPKCVCTLGSSAHHARDVVFIE